MTASGADQKPLDELRRISIREIDWRLVLGMLEREGTTRDGGEVARPSIGSFRINR